MQISSMYIGHEEVFNFILFNHFQSKCPLGTGPWWPLYMNGIALTGRTLDLPAVIELAPCTCKYKRVYFYFGVQKKLIFIYLFFFYFYFLGPIWLSFWGRFDLGPIWLEIVSFVPTGSLKLKFRPVDLQKIMPHADLPSIVYYNICVQKKYFDIKKYSALHGSK